MHIKHSTSIIQLIVVVKASAHSLCMGRALLYIKKKPYVLEPFWHVAMHSSPVLLEHSAFVKRTSFQLKTTRAHLSVRNLLRIISHGTAASKMLLLQAQIFHQFIRVFTCAALISLLLCGPHIILLKCTTALRFKKRSACSVVVWRHCASSAIK